MIVAPSRFASARPPVPLVALALALAGLLAGTPARAAFIAVNFDTTPALAAAGTTFSGTTQAVTLPGVATFTGGTLVGSPVGLASFTPGGGARNAYGTASFAGTAFANNLTLTAAAGVSFSAVTGTLFNGYSDLVTYTVSAYNGTTLLGASQFNDVGDTTDPTGFRNFNLASGSGPAITRLVVTADTTFTGGGFDYFLDNVGITYNPAAVTVPEPASAWLVALGGAAAWVARRRRRAAIDRSVAPPTGGPDRLTAGW